MRLIFESLPLGASVVAAADKNFFDNEIPNNGPTTHIDRRRDGTAWLHHKSVDRSLLVSKCIPGERRNGVFGSCLVNRDEHADCIVGL